MLGRVELLAAPGVTRRLFGLLPTAGSFVDRGRKKRIAFAFCQPAGELWPLRDEHVAAQLEKRLAITLVPFDDPHGLDVALLDTPAAQPVDRRGFAYSLELVPSAMSIPDRQCWSGRPSRIAFIMWAKPGVSVS